MTHAIDIHTEESHAFWDAALAHGKGPRYLRVVAFIEQAVADGRLRPGDRLPSQRTLASQLGVDFTTVTRAYTEAKRRHVIEGRGALGTFVASPDIEFVQMIDLGMNIPPAPIDASLGELMKEGVAQVLSHTDAAMLMTYQLGGGSAPDRHAGALWLAPMLGTIDETCIAVCPGAQSALAALLLTTTRHGDPILAEPLVYPGLRTATAALGRHIVSVETDDAGMRPDALAAACHESGARLVYLNPTLQNPTTVTMPLARRRDIIRVATQYGIEIIEDDPYWRLAKDAPPPLAQLAPDRVYYIATLSKCLTPGLRTAYVMLPNLSVRESFLSALHTFALMASPLMTGLATQWMHDGAALTILKGVRKASRARQQLAAQILGGAMEADGIHVWHRLPGNWTPRALAQAARLEGLGVTAADAFSVSADVPNAIRISLGGVKDSERLASALRRLGALLEENPRNQRETVV